MHTRPIIRSLSVITITFLGIFTAAQHIIRMEANNPQVQLAEDTAILLDGGAEPGTVVGPAIDITKSLQAFTTIYDENGASVATSGLDDGKAPTFPIGALKASTSHEHRVTWQRASGLRFAAVIVAVPSKHWYVVTARSLREPEKTVSEITWMLAAAWAACVALTILLRDRS